MDCGGRRFLRQRTVLLLRKLSIEMWTSAPRSDIRSAGYFCHMWWTNISVDMVARVLSVRTYVCPYLCLARMTAQWAPIASRSRRILRISKWGREKGMREESDIEMLTISLKLKKIMQRHIRRKMDYFPAWLESRRDPGSLRRRGRRISRRNFPPQTPTT